MLRPKEFVHLKRFFPIQNSREEQFDASNKKKLKPR